MKKNMKKENSMASAPSTDGPMTARAAQILRQCWRPINKSLVQLPLTLNSKNEVKKVLWAASCFPKIHILKI